MPDDTNSSSAWATENVLKQLEERTPAGQAVSAQVFLADTVPAEELAVVAKQIVEAATESAGEPSQPVEIGKIHRLAKSFSVKAAPSVIRELSNLGRVKAVLPSEIQEGMLIRPVKKRLSLEKGPLATLLASHGLVPSGSPRAWRPTSRDRGESMKDGTPPRSGAPW